MTEIIPFSFEGAEIRTVYRNDDPWFVAMDICEALGIANSRDAMDRLDDDEKDEVGLSDAIGRKQEMTVINESGLYILILRSRNAVKPGTLQHRFRKWVTSEVLPTIRKTSLYDAGTSEAAPDLQAGTRNPGYRLFEAIIRPDGNWGKVWAVPVYRLGDTDYWNVPLLLEAYCGSRDLPAHLSPHDYAYNLMRELPELQAASPLWVAHHFNLKIIIQGANGGYDKRTREFLEQIENAHLTEKPLRSGTVVHLRDVTKQPS